MIESGGHKDGFNHHSGREVSRLDLVRGMVCLDYN